MSARAPVTPTREELVAHGIPPEVMAFHRQRAAALRAEAMSVLIGGILRRLRMRVAPRQRLRMHGAAS